MCVWKCVGGGCVCVCVCINTCNKGSFILPILFFDIIKFYFIVCFRLSACFTSDHQTLEFYSRSGMSWVHKSWQSSGCVIFFTFVYFSITVHVDLVIHKYPFFRSSGLKTFFDIWMLQYPYALISGFWSTKIRISKHMYTCINIRYFYSLYRAWLNIRTPKTGIWKPEYYWAMNN